jgi:hypothetical protein
LEPREHINSRCRVSVLVGEYCTQTLATSGSIARIPKGKRPATCTWDSLFDTIPPIRPPGVSEQTQLEVGKSATSMSGDMCFNGSWVFYNTHHVCHDCSYLCSLTFFTQEESPSKAARVSKIIIGGIDVCRTFVILEPWDVLVSRDDRYGMPVLHRDHTESYFAVPPKVCLVGCPTSQIGSTSFRISTLCSTPNMIVKVEVVRCTRLMPSRSAKKH